MATDPFASAARSLALPVNDASDSETDAILPRSQPRLSSPTFSRRTRLSIGDRRPRSSREQWLRTADAYGRTYLQAWRQLSVLQQAGLCLAAAAALVLAVLFLVYNESIFAHLAGPAERWRNLPAGWLILWALTFTVSFPPLIGYSTCVTMAGFVFGMAGWPIVATATIAGSTCAFAASRSVLRGLAARLTQRSPRFAALALVLRRDGLALLVMIRLCPLPYSLSNAAVSTIPTVSWPAFALATAIASPKLLLHVFVGARLGDLARNGAQMDAGTKAVSYLSIAFGMVAGAATGYLVYVRTHARARQLEEEEEAARQEQEGGGGGATSDGGAPTAFVDSPASPSRDDISMHTTYEDDLEGGAAAAYRDEFTDDEDALERDVFDVGDGGDETGDEDERPARGRR